MDVIDRDDESRDEFVESFTVDISSTTLAAGSGMSSTFFINGLFRFASISLSFEVECLPGFVRETCVPICSTGHYHGDDTGDTYQKGTDSCQGVECSNNGSCVDGDQSFTCLCQQGFTGQLCDTKFDFSTTLDEMSGKTTLRPSNVIATTSNMPDSTIATPNPYTTADTTPNATPDATPDITPDTIPDATPDTPNTTPNTTTLRNTATSDTPDGTVTTSTSETTPGNTVATPDNSNNNNNTNNTNNTNSMSRNAGYAMIGVVTPIAIVFLATSLYFIVLRRRKRQNHSNGKCRLVSYPIQSEISFHIIVDGDIISTTVNPLYNMVDYVGRISNTVVDIVRKTVGGSSIPDTVHNTEDTILATEVNPAYNAHVTPTAACNIVDGKDTTSTTEAYPVYELISHACNTPTTANTESNIVGSEGIASDADSHAYEVVLTPATHDTACNNVYDEGTAPATLCTTVYELSGSKNRDKNDDSYSGDDESDYI